MTVRSAFVLLLVFACSAPGAARSDGFRLTLEDLLSIEPLGQPELSPDGKTFALVRGGQIVLMPSAGGWPVTLTTTPGGKSSLSWSPDGAQLAYASQGGIWVVPVAGGPPKRLTDAQPGPGDPRTASDRSPQWSPRGRWILFETGRRGNSDLMVVSEDGASANYLTMSEGDEGSASWSPDGTRVAFTERAPEYFSGKLKVIGFDPGTGRPAGPPSELHTAPTDRGGGWSIGKAAWSPDCKALAVVLQHSGWDKVYMVPAAGGPLRALTSGEYDDRSPVFSPDGKFVAVVSSRTNLEEHTIWIAPVDGSAPRRLLANTGPGMEADPQWAADCSKIYFTRATPLEPSNLLVAAATGGASPTYISHTLPRNFERAGLRMPEEAHFKSKDGLDIAAILYKPRDFTPGTRYPAVLWIHGGPEGQDGLGWDPWAHYLAQEGYVVLRPNYRGSSGYGEKFRNLNVGDSGGGEVDDVAAAVNFLIGQALADPARIGIGGGSHGGTMVAYAVTKYPDLFKAAIELYGVVDRATFNERTNRNSAIRWQMKMGGTPAEKPEVYRKANALADADKIKTPLLVMHGEEDPQVPPYESAQFVRALRQRNKVHYYFTYPGEGHGFASREHRLDAWKKQLAFLQKYLRPRYGLSSTSLDDLLLERSERNATPTPPPPPRR